MSQPIPDTERARQLSRDLLSTRLVDFIDREKADLLIENTYSFDKKVRTAVDAAHLEAYYKKPLSLTSDPSARDKIMSSSPINPDALTMREVLADYWCQTYDVPLTGLDQIRDFSERHMIQFARALQGQNANTERAKSGRAIANLFLAIDALERDGTVPQAHTIRDGIAALKAKLRAGKSNDAFYTARGSDAEGLAEKKYRERAQRIITSCTISVESGTVPDYVPIALRQEIHDEFPDMGRVGKDRILAELIALVKANEPATGIDISLVATSNAEGSKQQTAHNDFLMALIGRMNQIATTLAIPPDRKRTKAKAKPPLRLWSFPALLPESA